MSNDARAGIDALRSRIDALDARLVELLSERARCALDIGDLKRELDIAIYQPSRERDVLDHVCRLNQGPLDDEAMRRLFERIIDEARRLERVAAGAPGTIESED
jgi:chorismate mutase